MNFNESNQTSTYDKFAFGKFITTRRTELGISLRKLSKNIGVSAAYLHDIEKGARKAPENHMKTLIEYLHITDSELDSFFEMAHATTEYFHEFKDYLKTNQYAREFLRLAKEKKLSNEQWQDIINQIKEL